MVVYAAHVTNATREKSWECPCLINDRNRYIAEGCLREVSLTPDFASLPNRAPMTPPRNGTKNSIPHRAPEAAPTADDLLRAFDVALALRVDGHYGHPDVI